MASGRRIVVEFLGDDKSLSSTAKGATTSTSRLGDTLKKVGKVAAVGLAAGVAVAGKAMFDATKMAIEDEKSQALLANTLRNTAGANKEQIAATEDWISAQGKALGVTDDELRPALQRMAEATGDVEKAQRLVAVAMDVSAGTGRSLKSVTEAMLRAQNGSVDGLSRYGIATKNAAGETLSFDQVVKGMGDTFKGAATKSADTLEGKMGRLKLIFDETREEIGAKLIPIVTKLADWFLNKGLPAISKFGNWFKDNLIPIFQRVRDVVAKVMGGMQGDTSGTLGKIRGIVKDFVSIVRSLWSRFGKDILAFAKSAWKNIKALIGGALKVISGIFKVFSSALKGDWKGVWEGIKQILRGALDVVKSAIRLALSVVKLIFKTAWSAIKGIVSGAWDGIKTIARNGADWLVDAIRSIPDRLRGLAGVFASAGKALLQGFVDGMKNAAGIVSGIAGNVWDAVKGLLNDAIDKINSSLEFTIKLPGPDVTINPPNIPHLAKGGVVTRPTLALIGEDGPEAVVPLSRKHAPRGGVAVGGGGGNINITINGALDPVAVGRQVEQVLVKYQRSTGRPLQVRTS